MKNLWRIFACVVLLLGLISFKSFAQVHEWEWARSTGGNHLDIVTGIATDKIENVYVTGYFRSTEIVFGLDTLINSTAGNPEVFIAKYDLNGNVVWARSATGTGYDGSNDIDVDDFGNVYITGSFSSSSITFDKTILNNSGVNNTFIVKYNPDGNVMWAKSSEAYGGESICIFKNHFYLAGYFRSESITLGNTVLQNTKADSTDIFIANYDFDGNVIWAQSAGGSNDDLVQSITTDRNGDLLFTGFLTSKSIRFGDTVIESNGAQNMFVAKYNSEGKVLWARSSVNSYIRSGNDLVIDNDGNIYLTGTFIGLAITIGDVICSKTGDTDEIFLVKLNSDGNPLWGKTFGGDYEDESKCITIDNKENIYIAGSYRSSSISFENITLEHDFSSGSDIFIAKFDNEGSAVSVYTVGGIQSEDARAITATESGEVYISGTFISPLLPFDADTLIKFGGLNDIFIARLNTTITSIQEETKNNIHIFPNPTASQFHITNLSPGNWTIAIYTLDGQSVFKKELTEANAMIDLSGKAKGAYVYQLLKDGDVFKSGKLVLE